MPKISGEDVLDTALEDDRRRDLCVGVKLADKKPNVILIDLVDSDEDEHEFANVVRPPAPGPLLQHQADSIRHGRSAQQHGQLQQQQQQQHLFPKP